VTERRPIQCVGEESFSPTWVSDIVAAIQRLIELRLDGLFHVANDECFQRAELAASSCGRWVGKSRCSSKRPSISDFLSPGFVTHA